MPRVLSLVQRALRGPRKFLSAGPYIHDTTHRFGGRYPCFYCPRILHSDPARIRHILLSAGCRLADEIEGLSFLIGNTSLDVSPELEPEHEHEPSDTPHPETPAEQPDSSNPPHYQPPDPRLAGPPVPTSPATLDGSAPPLEYDATRQVYVKTFPDPRTGAPINDKVVELLDLDAYMARAGNLGHPEHFETAEILLTTGLTNDG
ncbi:hypothetical protein FRC06_008443 [Ceratobasidium sp. 370]|nr:hypothetical protein FRC06_008443 [Ceratobasidium sp. 370]